MLQRLVTLLRGVEQQVPCHRVNPFPSHFESSPAQQRGVAVGEQREKDDGTASFLGPEPKFARIFRLRTEFLGVLPSASAKFLRCHGRSPAALPGARTFVID